MLRTFLLNLLLIATLNANSCFAEGLYFKQKGTLSVCSYSEFKPVSYGEGKGFEADLLRAVAKKWGVNIKFYPEKFYEGLWHTPSESYSLCDVSIGGFSPATYRIKEGAVFTKITVFFSQSLLIRKKDLQIKKITSYSSFKNSKLKIGVVPGTTGEKYAYERAIESKVPLSAFIQFTSESELLSALKKGQIDAIARGEIGNEYQASLDKSLITIEKKNFGEGFAIAVDAKNENLLYKLCETINLITKNGEINYSAWLKNKNIFTVDEGIQPEKFGK